MSKVVCIRCKGRYSERCEQGGQACTQCDGTGVSEDWDVYDYRNYCGNENCRAPMPERRGLTYCERCAIL